MKLHFSLPLPAAVSVRAYALLATWQIAPGRNLRKKRERFWRPAVFFINDSVHAAVTTETEPFGCLHWRCDAMSR